MDPQLGQAIGLMEGQKVKAWIKDLVNGHALIIDVIRSMWNFAAIFRIVHQSTSNPIQKMIGRSW